MNGDGYRYIVEGAPPPDPDVEREAADCQWHECVERAFTAREMSVRPPGFTRPVDVTVRLCRGHALAISSPCHACRGVGRWRRHSCARCEGTGWVARDGAVIRLDWSTILEALGETGLERET